jgi:hypothetical protein
VTRSIFDLLKARSAAHGGSLSTADVDLAEAQFISSLLKAASYFEQLNHQHMQASGSTAPELFARQSILVTLLIACGHKAARAAFPQVESIGERWFRDLFGGIAKYVREFTCANADQRLTEAYFKLATTLGGHLRIADLLADDETRLVLTECLAPLIAKGADDKLAQPLSDVVAAHIAGTRGVAGANPVKITAGEMRQFLSFLPLEIRIELKITSVGEETRQSEHYLVGRYEDGIPPVREARSNCPEIASAK